MRAGFPACCDLLATGMGAAGFVYVTASVFSMFRAANIVLTALFSFFLLNRRYSYPRLFGLSLVMVSMILVGLAATNSIGGAPAAALPVDVSSSAEAVLGGASADVGASEVAELGSGAGVGGGMLNRG